MNQMLQMQAANVKFAEAEQDKKLPGGANNSIEFDPDSTLNLSVDSDATMREGRP